MSGTAKVPPVRTAALPLTALTTINTTRWSDYVSLARPRIALMVLISVSVGYLLGQEGRWAAGIIEAGPLLHACLGIMLVTAGSSAINQWYERQTDARMSRTVGRPLPSGRLSPREVLSIGLVLAVVGSAYLYWLVNPLTALLAAATCLIYTGVYTPLKRVTAVCTAVGAIPGAMPPVLGWTAAGQSLDLGAFALFGLVFLWQFPHFLAIAWLYRDDYAAAGLRMLPGQHPPRGVTGLMATGYALCLLPFSLIPSGIGMAGQLYAVLACLLGVVYVAASVGFAVAESRSSARRLLWVSLVYLPVILAALAGDHVRLLS